MTFWGDCRRPRWTLCHRSLEKLTEDEQVPTVDHGVPVPAPSSRIPPTFGFRYVKHRVYDEDDLDQLMWIACLAVTGMSVSDMKQYVANNEPGPSAAGEQVALLAAQMEQLA